MLTLPSLDERSHICLHYVLRFILPKRKKIIRFHHVRTFSLADLEGARADCAPLNFSN